MNEARCMDPRLFEVSTEREVAVLSCLELGALDFTVATRSQESFAPGDPVTHSQGVQGCL